MRHFACSPNLTVSLAFVTSAFSAHHQFKSQLEILKLSPHREVRLSGDHSMVEADKRVCLTNRLTNRPPPR